MTDGSTYLSFYLRANRIHIFTEALRGIGCPSYICFMLSPTGESLIIKPYPRKDYHSHRVPKEVYLGKKSMEISSMRLCRMIASMQGWNDQYSYRVPGKVLKQQGLVLFQLEQAECIRHPR